MNTVAIIQSRMGSHRLPGKVMMDIGGKPMLHRVIQQAMQIRNVQYVACTFPASPESKPMIDVAMDCGVQFFFGPEDNVLSRYHLAAVKMAADVIVRITADCPLIDPEVCDRVIKLRESEKAEYASNVHPRSFQRGLDCEVFTFRALDEAYYKATHADDIEHVTPFIVRHCDRRVNLASGRFDLANINWSVDTLEDLKRVRKVYKTMELAA